MKLNLKVEPFWLTNLPYSHKSSLQVTETGLLESGQTPKHFDWQEINALLVIDKGFLFATIVWQSQGEIHRFSWLPKKQAEALLAQANIGWCSFHGQRLIPLADSCYQLLNPDKNKRYLRKQIWLTIKNKASAEMKRWPKVMPEKGLNPKQQQAFERLQALAHWSTSDLQQYQQSYVASEQKRFADYFSTIEANPLTHHQQIACITDEVNNLVLAGAGTGKTSVMVGRAGYLINSNQARPDEILLLAFGKKAAKEMSERINTRLGINDLSISTFHALGQSIIATVEGKQPSLSPLAQDEKAKQTWLHQQFSHLLTLSSNADLRALTLEYFNLYLFEQKRAFEFNSRGEHYAYLKDNNIKSLQGDKVKSYGELLIANWLFKMGIKYHYQVPYLSKDPHRKVPVPQIKALDFRPYKPAFYLPDKNIYIEFWQLDNNGETPAFIDKTLYQQGIAWQRQLHQHHQTRLIETSDVLLEQGNLLPTLAKQLTQLGTCFNPLSDDDLFSAFADTGAIDKLTNLLGQMLSLYKGGGFDSNKLSKQIKQLYGQQQNNLPFAKNNTSSAQINLALQLLAPLYQAYQAMLAQQRQIDFDDMIIKATRYIQTGKFTSPWSYIMVDEFQDISAPRAGLVKALRDAVSGASLFCVGDDWQAIYRFAGSEVSLTRDFADYFGETQITTLDKTFRFNNSICDIASRFVSKNPAQLAKTLTTLNQVDKPAVSLYLSDLTNTENNLARLKTIFTAISTQICTQISTQIASQSLDNKASFSVFLLARYHYLLPEREQLTDLSQTFPYLNISALTIHASKGMEADFVVVLGLCQGKHGFPADKVNHLLIETLLPVEQSQPTTGAYRHAEERRLFYVALTRAKHQIYLLADEHRPSEFVLELLTDNYPITQVSFKPSPSLSLAKKPSDSHDKVNCRHCHSGFLQQKSSRQGVFYNCSNYPYCDHSEQACPKCHQLMLLKGKFKQCSNHDCDNRLKVCPQCQGELRKRSGPYGDFLGCKNYRSIAAKESNQQSGCDYKEVIVADYAEVIDSQ